MVNCTAKQIAIIAISAAGSLLAIKLLRLRDAWRLRTLPGPYALPLVGNAFTMVKTQGGFVGWRDAMHKTYGKVFKVWAGNRPLVIVSHYSVVRTIAQQSNERLTSTRYSIMQGEGGSIDTNGILALSPERHGTKFRSIRRAFEASVMSPVSLAGHEPTVQEAIARLITRLDRAAASGQAIDMLMYLNDMATDSIGFAAFGIDLHCQELTPERAVTLKRALTRSSTLTRSNSLRLSLPRAFSLTGSMRRDNVASPRQISDSAESPRSRNCVRLVSQDSVRVKPLGLPPVKEPEVLEDWMKRPGSRDFGHGLAVTLRTIMNEFMPPQGSVAKLVSFIVPELRHVIGYLARLLGEPKLLLEDTARLQVVTALRQILAEWREYKEAQLHDDRSVPVPAISERGFMVRLYEAAEAEGLTEQDVIDQAVSMLLAASETTASTLTYTLDFLARNPDKQMLVQAEVDAVLKGKTPTSADLEHLPYVSAVIDETLRLCSPADSSVRCLHKDIVLPDGKIIPSDILTVLDLRGLARDPDVWPRAEEFLPERWLPGNEHLAPSNPNAYVPFGLGARKCPGFKFALLQVRLGLARISQSFTWTHAPGKPDMTSIYSLVFSPTCLWLNVARRVDIIAE